MQSTPIAFSILHTNDMHSNFLGLGPVMDYTPDRSNADDHTVGGYARLATLIRQATLRPKRRRRTRPTAASIEHRVRAKKQRSETKQRRTRVRGEE